MNSNHLTYSEFYKRSWEAMSPESKHAWNTQYRNLQFSPNGHDVNLYYMLSSGEDLYCRRHDLLPNFVDDQDYRLRTMIRVSDFNILHSHYALDGLFYGYADIEINDESNLELARIYIASNDDTSYSLDVVGHSAAMAIYNELLEADGLTHEYLSRHGFYFSN